MQSCHVKSATLAIGLLLAAQTLAGRGDTASSYPELPIGKNYIRIAKLSISAWNKNLKLPEQEQAVALEYVLHRMTVREFEDMTVAEYPELKSGHSDIQRRTKAAYRTSYENCDWVSQQMAMGIVRDALRVY